MQRFSDEIMTALQGVVAKLAQLESHAEESDAKLAEVSRDLGVVWTALASSKAAPESKPEPASPATPAPAQAPRPRPRQRQRQRQRSRPRPRLRLRPRLCPLPLRSPRRLLSHSRRTPRHLPRPPSRSAFLPRRRPRSSSSSSSSGAPPRLRLSRHPSRHPSRRLLRHSPRRRTSSRTARRPPRRRITLWRLVRAACLPFPRRRRVPRTVGEDIRLPARRRRRIPAGPVLMSRLLRRTGVRNTLGRPEAPVPGIRLGRTGARRRPARGRPRRCRTRA